MILREQPIFTRYQPNVVTVTLIYGKKLEDYISMCQDFIFHDS